MARDFVAITVAGLNPCDPRQVPGMQLTARQQQALHAALRRAPSPAHALRLVREGLQRRASLDRILEDLRRQNGLAVLRPYATHPQGWNPPDPAARPRREEPPAPPRRPAPEPGNPRFG